MFISLAFHCFAELILKWNTIKNNNVERQTLLISLVLITLIVNIVLGIELYYALHRPSQSISQVPVNISGLELITSNTTSTVTHTATSASTTSISTTSTESNVTYSFSFKAKFKIHVRERGIYLIGISPNNNTFAQLYIILYFEDGQVVSLNLNHTSANITIDDKEIEVTAYISGKSYYNMSPQEVLDNIRLYLKFISPINSSSDDSEENDMIDATLLIFNSIKQFYLEI